ncbi:hypothetical protein A7D16_17060 [Xanthomonas nasturtii]|nr:hypothetical protein A7D16_17060 [Xanthomonas nasturtii]
MAASWQRSPPYVVVSRAFAHAGFCSAAQCGDADRCNQRAGATQACTAMVVRASLAIRVATRSRAAVG